MHIPVIIPFLMVLDILKPYYYKLEKSVAARSIPAVHEIPNRKTLAATGSSIGGTFDHSLWNTILQSHLDTAGTTIGDVSGITTVDYAGISKDPDFDSYLSQLEKADPSTLAPAEQLAFWINAYNALCINLIVTHERLNPPLSSINQLSGAGKAVWDKTAGKINGKDVSLNHIEHEQLRGTWDEPGIHACIVCASASCPNLRNEAFVGPRVFEQMEDQVQKWLQNPTKGAMVENKGFMSKKRVTLSRIFLWFGDDFGGQAGLRHWLPKYSKLNTELAVVFGGNENASIRFFEYDWSVNRKK